MYSNIMSASNVIADHVMIGGADEAFLEVDDGIRDKNGMMDGGSISSSTSCSMVSTSASKVSSNSTFIENPKNSSNYSLA